MTFVETFGGDNVNPAQLSFASYSPSADLTLSWPFEALDDANPLAAKINVAPQAANLSVIFPDASVASEGQDALVKNTGAHTFSVKDASGNTIGTVASGEAWFFYLTDNSSVAGTWDSVEFGAGTSSASAASLAGAGLEASVTILNQNLPTSTKPSDYSPNSGDRATVLRGTGGVVTYTPDPCADLGDGWFVYVVNAGSGTLTWDPDSSETIDGAATKVFQPDESAIVFCDGSNFWTVGYGRAITSTVTGVSISAAGTGAMTLSAAEVAAQVQNYTGALTGNRIVNFGTGVGYWFVYNNTSGAFSLTLRVNGGDAGAAVAQGSYSIVRSDGTNLDVAFTATSGTVTSVGTGTGLTGGPVVTSGTISLANTAVTPGTYGSASEALIATVDQQGRLTALSETPIAITASQITDINSILFVGMIAPSAAAATPTGWLPCDGAAVSRATYAALFSAIGTAYGAGDGTTTFNVPDLGGRVPAGVEAVATRLTTAISGVDGATRGSAGGDQRTQSHTHTTAAGTLAGFSQTVDAGVGFGVNNGGVTGSYGAGGSQNVQPTLIVNYVIKT
jgi:microcystin-dependent protein